jgi:hypothetical protein
MQTFWTWNNLYCVTLNRNTRRFYVDFVCDSRIRNGRTNVVYSLEYLTSWTIRNGAILIALKNRNYIYISSKIVQFTLDEGDMIVRFIPAFGNRATALITRFNTIYFDENVDMYYLIDKSISRPPELNLGFRTDEEFVAKYNMIFHIYIGLHSGKGLLELLLNNA